ATEVSGGGGGEARPHAALRSHQGKAVAAVERAEVEFREGRQAGRRWRNDSVPELQRLDVDERIGAVVAVDGGLEIRDGGDAVMGLDRIVRDFAGEDRRVRSRSSVQGIVARSALQPIVSRAARHRIVAAAAVQSIGAVAAGQMIIALAAGEAVRTVAAGKNVVAALSLEGVIALVALERVVSVSAFQ